MFTDHGTTFFFKEKSLAYFPTCQKVAKENYINIAHFSLYKVPQNVTSQKEMCVVGAGWHPPLIPVLRMQRQANLFKVSLVYTASWRPTRLYDETSSQKWG